MASGNKVNAIKESVSRFSDVADFRKMARSLETCSPLSSFALSVKRKMASLLLCSREVASAASDQEKRDRTSQ